jgi:hypothetical protein
MTRSTDSTTVLQRYNVPGSASLLNTPPLMESDKANRWNLLVLRAGEGFLLDVICDPLAAAIGFLGNEVCLKHSTNNISSMAETPLFMQCE